MTATTIHESDWLRFEVPDTRILEGFVQAISEDGKRVRIGKAPDSLESEWYDLNELTILQTQTLGSPI